jgi:hypothetical protein
MSIRRRPHSVLVALVLCLPGGLLGRSTARGAQPTSLFYVPDFLAPAGAADGPFNIPLPPAAAQVPRLPTADPGRPAVELTSASGPPEFYPWAEGAPGSREPRQVQNQSAGVWGSLTAKVVCHEGRPPAAAWEEPLRKQAWQTEEAWKLPLTGPVFVFGQLGANSEETAQQDMKVAGRTGLACKLPVGSAAELVVRSGPGLSCTDPLRPPHARERSDWLVEVQARLPLLFGIGLEYQGSAAPSLNPQDPDQVNQDLRLAFPVGGAGKVQVGARHRWQNTPDPRPGSDGMQLYLGLELAR